MTRAAAANDSTHNDPPPGRWPPSPLTRGEGLLSSRRAKVKVSSPSPRVERGEGGQRPGEGSCGHAKRATGVSLEASSDGPGWVGTRRMSLLPHSKPLARVAPPGDNAGVLSCRPRSPQ